MTRGAPRLCCGDTSTIHSRDPPHSDGGHLERGRTAHRPVRADDAPGVFRAEDERHGGVRALRAQAAAVPQFPARRRTGAGARISRGAALHRRRSRMAPVLRTLHTGVRRLARRPSLHRRRRRHAGGHGLLRRRADPAHQRAAARGPARREPRDEPRALRDAGRVQGCALGAGRARTAARRLRAAPRARRRGRPAVGARELPRRVCRNGDRRSGTAVRCARLRHDGALVRPGARRRSGRVRELRAGAPGERRAADRHVRHRTGRAQGRRSVREARRRRRAHLRRAHRQRRPRRACAARARDSRCRRPARDHDLRERQSRRVSVARARAAAGADRRLRGRHADEHLGRRALPRLRLQAGGIRRTAAAEALGRQGDVAGPQAGVPAVCVGRQHGRRFADAGTGRRIRARRSSSRSCVPAAWSERRRRSSRSASGHARNWAGFPNGCARSKTPIRTRSRSPRHCAGWLPRSTSAPERVARICDQA